MPAPLIAPSILAADFARLGDDVAAVLRAGADLIHFDVMDNHYVPNLSFGPMVLTALRNYGIDAPVDVHLMVEPVDPLIDAFAAAGANWISFHPDASRHVHRSLALIRGQGCKAGLVLNPASPVDLLQEVLPLLDFVLVMSVNPGFGGQSFIPASLDKLRRVKAILQHAPIEVRVAIDGGIKIDNIGAAAAAGADTFIAGSAIFAAQDYAAVIAALRAELALAQPRKRAARTTGQRR